MQTNFMMYGGGAPQQGQAGGQQQDGTTPEGQQQPPMQGYPGLFPPGPMPYFSQSQAAAAAHAAAAMAEQRLSGMEQSGGYGGGGYAPGGGYAGGYGDESYMEANRLLIARLQQQGAAAQGNWMMPMGSYGYGMPQPPPDLYAETGPWSNPTAGLFGKTGMTEEKKKTVRKKHKDKPKRPLSAYNLFFKDERANILKAIPSKGKEAEQEVEDDKKEEGGERKDDGGGDDDDDDDKKKGRKGKKIPHGKIGFESLAKAIGERWQKLEPERLEHYKKLAAEDMKRYKEQMEVFLTKLESEKKRKVDPGLGGGAGEDEDDYYEPVAKKVKGEEEQEEEI